MDTRKPVVWIVEDDDDLREEIVAGLTERGLTVTGFGNALLLYAALLSERCDIVLLDIGLPDEDGYAIAKRLRGSTSIGIIMLTARGLVEDRIRGLSDGADAYLVKPVDLAELEATIISVFRRLEQAQQTRVERAESGQGWTVTGDGWTLVSPEGKKVPLSHSERVIVDALLRHPGRVLPRDDLVHALGYKPDNYPASRLDMLLSRLRRKVESQVGQSLPVISVRGQGLVFQPE